jgi:hypothetical protein
MKHEPIAGWPPVNLQGAASALALSPVLKAGEVAALLRVSEDTFRNRRRALEAVGFPQKLPGLAGWSRACVMRWIETNGETFRPADGALEVAARDLEREYGA